MSDILCSYPDREAMLMAYLYEEITRVDRVAFDAHLTTCARCRVELNGLGGVRAQLSGWAPPDYRDRPAVTGEETGRPRGQLLTIGEPRAPIAGRQPASTEHRAPSTERHVSSTERRSWRDIPAWAQYAAAVLVLGVSAGAANLHVHYDSKSGLNVRTGWGHGGEVAQQQPAAAADVASRTELTALEQQLRSEIQAAAAAAPVSARAASAPTPASADADTMRRVHGMLDEVERRHERELALRVAEVMRDVNSQRQADLRKIDQNLYVLEGRTGVEVMKNRQMIDMYLQRVSQRQ